MSEKNLTAKDYLTIAISVVAILISIASFAISIYEKSQRSKLVLDQFALTDGNEEISLLFFLKNEGNKRAEDITISLFLPGESDSIIFEYYDKSIVELDDKAPMTEESYNLRISKLFPNETFLMKISMKEYGEGIPYVYSIRSHEEYYSYYPKQGDQFSNELMNDILQYIDSYNPSVRKVVVENLSKFKGNQFIINYCKQIIDRPSYRSPQIYRNVYELLGKIGLYDEVPYLMEKIEASKSNMDYYFISRAMVSIIENNELSPDGISELLNFYEVYIKAPIAQPTPAGQVITDIWYALSKQKNISQSQKTSIINRLLEYIEERQAIEQYMVAISKLTEIVSNEPNLLTEHPIADRLISIFSIQLEENDKTYGLTRCFSALKIKKSVPVLLRAMINVKSSYIFCEINLALTKLTGIHNQYLTFKDEAYCSIKEEEMNRMNDNRQKIIDEWNKLIKK